MKKYFIVYFYFLRLPLPRTAASLIAGSATVARRHDGVSLACVDSGGSASRGVASTVPSASERTECRMMSTAPHCTDWLQVLAVFCE
jgi:hypothetical protein